MMARPGARLLPALLPLIALLVSSPGSLQAKSWEFTNDEDFEGGELSSVQYDTIHDQLQLSGTSQTEPYIYIANHRYGTVSKVDTDTGKEVARYPSCLNGVGNTNQCPPGNYYSKPHAYCDWASRGHCPSRTAVDLNGDVWVANRAFGLMPSVTKIAGAFDRCVDRNGNGIIETSMDTSGNGRIDLTDSESIPETGTGEWRGQADECVLFTVPVGTTNALARGLAVDGQNNIWVGMYNTGLVHKLRNADGVQLGQYTNGSNIYGLAVDGLGYIYNSELSSGRIRKMSTSTGALLATVDTPRATYGLAVEGTTQVVWLGIWEYYGAVLKVDFKTNSYVMYQNPQWGNTGRTRGVAIDNDGMVWVANFDANKVGKFDPKTNTWVASYAVGSGPIGVAIDSSDRIWTANSGGNATRIDPTTGARIDSSALGAEPYSYSDMTGYQLTQAVVQQGTWTGLVDSGAPGRAWGTVTWNSGQGSCPPQGCQPPDTEILVDVRAYDGTAPQGTWVPVENGVPFTGAVGQHLQVKVVLRVSGASTVSPVLTDLTVTPTNVAPVCVAAAAQVLACAGATQVSLDGSGSSDLDEDTLSYTWSAGTCGALSPSFPGQGAATGSAWLDGTGTCQETCALQLAVGDGALSTTCTQEVTIVDSEAPVLAPPPATQVECNDGGAGIAKSDAQVAAFRGAAQAIDACQGNLPVTDDLPTWLALGPHAVGFQVSDGCEHGDAGVSSLEVVDTTPPALTVCPADKTVALDPQTCTAQATEVAEAVDACHGPLSESHQFSFTAPGAAWHTYVLADPLGHEAVCTQTVRAVDTDAPLVTCPDDVALTLDPDTCEASTTVTVTGTDGCAGPVSASRSYAFTAPGQTAATYVLKDGVGNKTTCTQTISAADATAPKVTARASRILYPATHEYITLTLTDMATARDNCVGSLSVMGPAASIVSVSSDEADDAPGLADGTTTQDIVIVDSHTVKVRSERSQLGNGRVYTVDIAVQDASGNTGTTAWKVLVPTSRATVGTVVDDGPAWTVTP